MRRLLWFAIALPTLGAVSAVVWSATSAQSPKRRVPPPPLTLFASGMNCFSLQNVKFSQLSQQPRVDIGRVIYKFSNVSHKHWVYVSKSKTSGHLDYVIESEGGRPVVKGTVKIKTPKPDAPVGLVICPKDYTEPGADFYTVTSVGTGWRLAISIGYHVKAVPPPQRVPPIKR